MASKAISTLFASFISFLLVLPTALSQVQAQSSPTISQCGPLFLPLAVCAPFVQGTAQAPGQSCCDNLNRLYGQEPQCLCLVLGDNPISTAFPINRTLALQLPSLCSLHFSSSTCSGGPGPGPATAVAKSPSSQVSLGANDNPTTAASPSPTTSGMTRGHTITGFRPSGCHAMKATIHVAITLLGTTLFISSLQSTFFSI